MWAIGQIDQLDRRACRQQAEMEYFLGAIGDRLEAWFGAMPVPGGCANGVGM